MGSVSSTFQKTEKGEGVLAQEEVEKFPNTIEQVLLFLINVIILLFIQCLRCVKLRIVALMPDMASAVTWIPGMLVLWFGSQTKQYGGLDTRHGTSGSAEKQIGFSLILVRILSSFHMLEDVKNPPLPFFDYILSAIKIWN